MSTEHGVYLMEPKQQFRVPQLLSSPSPNHSCNCLASSLLLSRHSLPESCSHRESKHPLPPALAPPMSLQENSWSPGGPPDDDVESEDDDVEDDDVESDDVESEVSDSAAAAAGKVVSVWTE